MMELSTVYCEMILYERLNVLQWGRENGRSKVESVRRDYFEKNCNRSEYIV